MKKKINVKLNLVEKFIKEGVQKTLEKSGGSFRSKENIQEVGKITLDSKEYILFSADKGDKKRGANYRMGEKIGKEYHTRPVLIDLNNNTIKLAKDENSWTQEYRIKKINLEVPEQEEEDITEDETTEIVAEGNIPQDDKNYLNKLISKSVKSFIIELAEDADGDRMNFLIDSITASLNKRKNLKFNNSDIMSAINAAFNNESNLMKIKTAFKKIFTTSLDNAKIEE